MDHIGILKRMWQMLWRYRALWVFGLILALTMGAGGGSNNGAQFSGGGSNGNGNGAGIDITPPEEIQTEIERLGRALEGFFDSGDWSLVPIYFSALIVALCCVGFLLTIVGAIAHYVSETALIRMVDHYEATGEKKTVGQGFRLGWSRTAWRLFLIGLVVTVPIVIAAVLLLGLAGLPLLAWITENTVLGVFGTIITIGLFFLTILALIAVGIVATVLVRLAWRAAALDNLGVGPALRRSWLLMRRKWQDVGLMWLIMLGINLAYSILSIPVVLVAVLIAAIAGGLSFGVLWALVRIFTAGEWPWVIGAMLGIPVFFLVIVVPLKFLEGLRQVYQSGVWTLTYRELSALETLDTNGHGEEAKAEDAQHTESPAADTGQADSETVALPDEEGTEDEEKAAPEIDPDL